MRQHTLTSALLSAVLSLIVFSGTALADLSTQQIVDDFNAMNNLQGYLFRAMAIGNGSLASYGLNSGEIRLQNTTDSVTGQTPDLSAYDAVFARTANNGSGINFSFQTFCVAPEWSIISDDPLKGRLNYESDQTRTYNGNSLTVGVAWLYKEFAAGSLDGYYYDNIDPVNNRVNSAVMLQDAIWFLLGKTGNMFVSTGWTDNDFLQLLLSQPDYDQAFWLATYNPANNYSGLMEDAKVFVVNVNNTANPANVRQDVLYVVHDGGGTLVPEPATLLLWTLGCIGGMGVAYHNHRKSNK